MKRSRTEAAEPRQRIVRVAADRPLRKALSVIGDRWTLLILNQCFLKLRRYGESQSSLGLLRPLLAVRLKKMVRHGMLKKVPSRKSAWVHEYLLTEKGRQLYPVLLALVQWGNALAEEEVEPSIHEHVLYGELFAPIIALPLNDQRQDLVSNGIDVVHALSEGRRNKHRFLREK